MSEHPLHCWESSLRLYGIGKAIFCQQKLSWQNRSTRFSKAFSVKCDTCNTLHQQKYHQEEFSIALAT